MERERDIGVVGVKGGGGDYIMTGWGVGCILYSTGEERRRRREGVA